MSDKQKSITACGIDKLLKFLPIFEQNGYRCAEWVQPPPSEDGINVFPFLKYYEAVNEFITILYEEGFIIISFDWVHWQYGKNLCKNPKALEKAKLKTLQKLLTVHIRCERFCEGHLAIELESGDIIGILRRLKEIRNKMNDSIDDKY